MAQAASEAVGVLALFDGIGGFRRALDLLGVTPGAFFASEIDKAAMRCVSAAYPQVVHLGDITLLGVHTWRQMTTEHPRVRLWFVPARFPCQDLSSLNKVVRKGLGATEALCTLRSSGSSRRDGSIATSSPRCCFWANAGLWGQRH